MTVDILARYTDACAACTSPARRIRGMSLLRQPPSRAWFPGPIFPDEPLPPSGEGGPVPVITYDITLTDGTVITDAEPSDPQ